MSIEFWQGRCPCGQMMEISGAYWAYREYINNEIVYEVCIHGITIIDKRGGDEKGNLTSKKTD